MKPYYEGEAMTSKRHSWYCDTCQEVGRSGYCAPARCYCGHEDCHAFASFGRITESTAQANTARMGKTWEKGGVGTWLDN